MRLLIRLLSLDDSSYDFEYYSKVQAFIYELIRDSEYDYIHSKYGYKFFCFSNIFPIGDIKKGEFKHLLISSPSSRFIRYLYNQLRHLNRSHNIRIGNMNFSIDSVKIFKMNIPKSDFFIVTSTPVILRIPRKYFELYGINVDKPWIYWRKEYGLKSFLNMTKLNIFKKYIEFFNEKPRTIDIYQGIKFVKSVAVYTNIDKERVQLIGSIWEFRYLYIDKELKKVLEFVLDTGLGERNSLGFGFLNILRFR